MCTLLNIIYLPDKKELQKKLKQWIEETGGEDA